MYSYCPQQWDGKKGHTSVRYYTVSNTGVWKWQEQVLLQTKPRYAVIFDPVSDPLWPADMLDTSEVKGIVCQDHSFPRVIAKPLDCEASMAPGEEETRGVRGGCQYRCPQTDRLARDTGAAGASDSSLHHPLQLALPLPSVKHAQINRIAPSNYEAQGYLATLAAVLRSLCGWMLLLTQYWEWELL